MKLTLTDEYRAKLLAEVKRLRALPQNEVTTGRVSGLYLALSHLAEYTNEHE